MRKRRLGIDDESFTNIHSTVTQPAVESYMDLIHVRFPQVEHVAEATIHKQRLQERVQIARRAQILHGEHGRHALNLSVCKCTIHTCNPHGRPWLNRSCDGGSSSSPSGSADFSSPVRYSRQFGLLAQFFLECQAAHSENENESNTPSISHSHSVYHTIGTTNRQSKLVDLFN